MDQKKESLVDDILKELDLAAPEPAKAPAPDDIDSLLGDLLEHPQEPQPEEKPEAVPAREVLPDVMQPEEKFVVHLPDDDIPPVAPSSTFEDMMAETSEFSDPFEVNPMAFEELPEEEDADAFEYRDPDEREEMLGILKQRNYRGFFRSVLLLVMLLCSMGIALCKRTPDLLPDIFSPAEGGFGYLLLTGIPLVFAMVIGFPMIASGFAGLFKTHGNRYTLPALTAAVSLIQLLVGALDPNAAGRVDLHFYAPIAVAGLFFASLGAFMHHRRTLRQFKFITADAPRYATLQVADKGAAIDITRGMLPDELPAVAYRKEAGFFDGFFSMTDAEDAADRTGSVAVPLVLAIAVCLGVAGYLLTNDIQIALTALTALLAIASPFAALPAVNLPANRVSKKLEAGAALLGGRDLEEISYTNAVLFTGQELFPAGSVALQGIKTFSGNRVDEALIDAASVICEGKSLLSDVFRQILAGDTQMLRPVDQVLYEDLRGIVAGVEGREVLIGSRDLMISHGIQVPTREYEKRYAKEGMELVYLATAHELTAVFLVTLQADENVERALQALESEGIPIVVQTADALLTGERIADLFGLSEDTVRILPARLHGVCSELEKPADRVRGAVVTNGNLSSYIYSIVSSIRMRSTVNMSLVLQTVGTVLGIALAVLLVLTGETARLTGSLLLAYQLGWTVISLLLPSLKRL